MTPSIASSLADTLDGSSISDDEKTEKGTLSGSQRFKRYGKMLLTVQNDAELPKLSWI